MVEQALVKEVLGSRWHVTEGWSHCFVESEEGSPFIKMALDAIEIAREIVEDHNERLSEQRAGGQMNISKAQAEQEMDALVKELWGLVPQDATSMDIDEMPAGRELDARVAEKVMGWTEVVMFGVPPEGLGVPPEGDDLYGTIVEGGIKATIPDYSTDMGAAWPIVEKHKFVISSQNGQHGGSYPDDMWLVRRGTVFAIAETAPLAICRVALKLMEGKEHAENRPTD